MGKSPTEAQVTYAKNLGIDIPRGIGRSQLADLITHAKARDASQEFGMDRHPDEIALPAAAGMDATASPKTQIQQAALILRRLRIHESSIIQGRGFDDRPFVVIGIEKCALLVQSVVGRQDKSRWDILPHDPGNDGDFKLVFNPPERYLHRFCYRFQLRNRIVDLRRSDTYFVSREKCFMVLEGFLDQVADELTAEHKVRHVHGDFWQRDAVAAYVEAEFLNYMGKNAKKDSIYK